MARGKYEELKEKKKIAEHNYTVAIQEQIENSIPKSVIQDKIEELGISDTDILIRYTLEEILKGE